MRPLCLLSLTFPISCMVAGIMTESGKQQMPVIPFPAQASALEQHDMRPRAGKPVAAALAYDAAADASLCPIWCIEPTRGGGRKLVPSNWHLRGQCGPHGLSVQVG